MFLYVNLLLSFFWLLCSASVIPGEDLQNVPNLFNLPGMMANDRTDIELVEGDIAIPVTNGRNAFIQAPKWPNNIVPYVIDGVFSATQKTIITGAMNTISQATNNWIKFVGHTNQPHWIRIFAGRV